ncbi:MAG: alanine racemase [Bdellovibrionales bacterium]
MARLTIDLTALRHNYRLIAQMVGANCKTAAVVKANAYGTGLTAAAQALQREGCDLFFVATLPEALELRTIIGDGPQIAMLNGFDAHRAALYTQNAIIPVIHDPASLKAYKTFGQSTNDQLPTILHLDTGINRLGFDAKQSRDMLNDPRAFDGVDVLYLMTHFCSAEDTGTDSPARQFESFTALARLAPEVKISACNSAALFRNQDWHGDMVRPGMALYGLNPTPDRPNPMRPVVRLEAEILQIREAQNGEACGYNETYRFDENTRLAVVSYGYADGFLRSLSNAGHLYWNGYACPVRGRVSMDLTIVELPDLPENDMPQAGDMMEIIGPHQSADDLAAQAGTIGYEILTSLSRRAERVYV